MNWPRISGILLVCVGTTGCATSMQRLEPGTSSSTARTGAWSKTTAPRQVQVSLPPEQPDIFTAAAAAEPSRLDKYRLSRYFPGLGRPSPATAAVSAPVATQGQGIAARATITPTDKVVAASTTSPRPSWFGLRKAKPAQTYLTDARPGPAKSNAVEPSYLPVALQLPTNRVADRAVTPTSVELPEPTAKGEADSPAVAATTVPTNPDASTAAASPLSTTEPQLSVQPFATVTAESSAKSEPESPLEPTVAKADEPAPRAAEEPAVDPRERPRMPSNGASFAPPPTTETTAPAPAEAQPAAEAKPAAEEAPQVAQAEPSPPTGDARAIKATPTGVDPTNSLGLPRATVPASYSQHNSVAVRGSDQAPQPPPVLASPQVGPSPQSVAPTTATKTWRRPCLRRLIRRMCNLGEFANPPTAKPH